MEASKLIRIVQQHHTVTCAYVPILMAHAATFLQVKRRERSTQGSRPSGTLMARFVQVLLKAARALLKVPFKRATDGTFVEVASLAQIYKVFERC